MYKWKFRKYNIKGVANLLQSSIFRCIKYKIFQTMCTIDKNE